MDNTFSKYVVKSFISRQATQQEKDLFECLSNNKEASLAQVKALKDGRIEKVFQTGVVVTLLYNTAMHDKGEFVTELIKKWANPNKGIIGENGVEKHPLVYCAQMGYINSVQALLKGGADVNMKNYEPRYQPIPLDTRIDLLNPKPCPLIGYQTSLPLHQALAAGHNEIAALLLKAGAKKHAQEEEEEKHSLGGGLFLYKKSTYTPLYVAVAKENLEGVKLLLKAGVNPDRGATEQTRDYRVIAPLEVAQNLKNQAIIDELEKAGATVYGQGDCVIL